MPRNVASPEDLGDMVGRPWKRWGLGVGGAVALVGYGVRCVALGRAWLPGRQGGIELVGATALALGIAYVALGALLHFSCFWEEHPKLWRFSAAGKLAAVVAFIAALGYVLVRSLSVF